MNGLCHIACTNLNDDGHRAVQDLRVLGTLGGIKRAEREESGLVDGLVNHVEWMGW
jgi:hypothetical protein